jgi:hypothetical protein
VSMWPGLAFGLYLLIGVWVVFRFDAESLGVFFGVLVVLIIWPVIVAVQSWRCFRVWWDSIAMKHPM